MKQLEDATLPLDDTSPRTVTRSTAPISASIQSNRVPVAIGDGLISAGGMSATYSVDDRNSLLLAYLGLVRAMRRETRAPTIVLRREDIEALATYLDEPAEPGRRASPS